MCSKGSANSICRDVSKSEKEPFPLLDDPKLDVVQMGVHAYNAAMDIQPLDAPCSLSYPPLFVGSFYVCDLYKQIRRISSSCIQSDTPILIDAKEASEVIPTAIAMVKLRRELHPAHIALSNSYEFKSPLVHELFDYFSTFPTMMESTIRSISPKMLLHELSFYLRLALMEYIIVTPRLGNTFQDFRWKKPEHLKYDWLLYDLLAGPVAMRKSSRRGGGSVTIFDRACLPVVDALIREAWMRKGVNGLKEVKMIWEVWSDVAETAVKLCIWVHEHREMAVAQQSSRAVR